MNGWTDGRMDRVKFPQVRGDLWTRWELRAQFSLVYAYGGLAKCSSEFVVRGEPLRTYVLAALRAEPAAPGLRQLRGVIEHPLGQQTLGKVPEVVILPVVHRGRHAGPGRATTGVE